MAIKSKNTMLFFFFLLFFSFFCSCHSITLSYNISAVIAFGDSTLDPGNNNAIALTMLRADHPPYGCDFPGNRPTGRFSDGKLISDFLVSDLGIKDILPAYLDPNLNTDDMVTGVSFASAGSGLDDLTATNVNVLTMGRQLEYFKEYLTKLQSSVGENRTKTIVNDALFLVGAGSNDIMMNYDILSTRKNNFTLPHYHDFILQKLQSFVEQLYGLGARKIAISGLPPLGCLPFTMNGEDFTTKTCIDQQNNNASSYNDKLQTQINRMQYSLKGTTMAYVDTYTTLLDMIHNPKDYGFVDVAQGCCGTGDFVHVEMGPLCNSLVPVCDDPSRHLFWDAVHPSQAAYEALAVELEKSTLPIFL